MRFGTVKGFSRQKILPTLTQDKFEKNSNFCNFSIDGASLF